LTRHHPSRKTEPMEKKTTEIQSRAVISDIDCWCRFDEEVDVTELIENPRNPNKHPDKQIALLAKIIRSQGWRQPITVSKRSGFIVKGHGRLQAAKVMNVVRVPVEYQDYATEAEEYADLIADNRIAELAEPDQDMIAELLNDDLFEGFDMDLTGFGDWIPDLGTDGDTDPDEIPEEPPPVCRLGQIWKLGDHRVMCGDSTDSGAVSRLLGEERPHLMVTDPPYGVEYDPSWRNEAPREDGKPLGASALGKVLNDDRADWREAWALFPGDVAYVWHAGLQAGVVADSLISCGFELKSQIVWSKSNFAIGRSHYHWKHEPCWYAVREKKTGHYEGDRKQTTVWEIDKPMKSETGHGTQKPVECMERPIRNNSVQGDSVYEPFSGSGTTHIACEKTGRRCFGMELDPKYCDVIIKRWEDFTGKKAELINE